MIYILLILAAIALSQAAITPRNNGLIEGLGRGHPLESAGAPVNGTSEVQTVTITGTPTGGTFTLTFNGFTTAPIAYNANAAAVQAALEALPNGGVGQFTCGGGALPGTPVTVTFAGNYGKLAVNTMTADGSLLTGGASPAVAVTETTPGVTATQRGAANGALLIDTTNNKEYINTGTALAPTWTVVGTQT